MEGIGREWNYTGLDFTSLFRGYLEVQLEAEKLKDKKLKHKDGKDDKQGKGKDSPDPSWSATLTTITPSGEYIMETVHAEGAGAYVASVGADVGRELHRHVEGRVCYTRLSAA